MVEDKNAACRFFRLKAAADVKLTVLLAGADSQVEVPGPGTQIGGPHVACMVGFRIKRLETRKMQNDASFHHWVGHGVDGSFLIQCL